VQLDHVLIAVADLADAAQRLEARHGLASLEGGRHKGLGTANRIVPLGDTYLELVAVVDEAEAAESVFGSWVASGQIPRLLGWCVRARDLDTIASRLGLSIADGSRTRADGTVLRWRMAGLEQSAREPSLPFFIEWGPGTPYPGLTPIEHRIGAPRIEELGLYGDPDRLAHWLGGENLPVAIHQGDPAVQSIVLASDAGQDVLDESVWA
jgi:Glyoxalase-like domain